MNTRGQVCPHTGDVCAKARGQKALRILEVLRDESVIGENDPSEGTRDERILEIKAECSISLSILPSMERSLWQMKQFGFKDNPARP